MRLLFLLAAMAAVTPVLSAPLSVQLRDRVRVEGPLLMVGEVALLEGDPATVRMASSIRLGLAPRVGYPERFRRDQVAQVLQMPLTWSGAQAVTVTRAAQAVDRQSMVTAALHSVRAAIGEPSLQASVPPEFAAVEVPMGKVSLRQRTLQHGRLAARMVVKVDIDVDGVFYGTVNVPVQLSLVRQVPVTTRELGAGHVLTAADFALEQRDIAGIGEPLASITPGGMRLKRGIGAGRALVAADVIQEGAAMRGDRVSLRATQGGAGIEADAQIVRGGSVGDLVGVTIGSSPAVLQGRLVAPGQVVLQ